MHSVRRHSQTEISPRRLICYLADFPLPLATEWSLTGLYTLVLGLYGTLIRRFPYGLQQPMFAMISTKDICIPCMFFSLLSVCIGGVNLHLVGRLSVQRLIVREVIFFICYFYKLLWSLRYQDLHLSKLWNIDDGTCHLHYNHLSATSVQITWASFVGSFH